MSEQVFKALKSFDVYNAMEIQDHIVPEYVSETFSYEGVEVVIELPVQIVLSALRGELDSISDKLGFTSPKGTVVYWNCIDILTTKVDFKIGERKFSARFEVRYDFMWFSIQEVGDGWFQILLTEKVSNFSFKDRSGQVSADLLNEMVKFFNFSKPDAHSNNEGVKDFTSVRLFMLIAPFVD